MAFLIASGTLQPETVVDPLSAQMWVFNPVTGQAWSISSALYFDVTGPGSRDVGFPLMVMSSVDALGHYIQLAPAAGAIPQSLELSNGAGQRIALALGRMSSYPDGLDPGGTVWRHAVTAVTDETKAGYNQYAYHYDQPGQLLTEVIFPSSIGNRSIAYEYADAAYPEVLSAIANSAGAQVTFEYEEDPADLDERLNPRLKIKRITDPTGVAFEYAYDDPQGTVVATVSEPGAAGTRRITTYAYLQDEDTRRRYVTSTTTVVQLGFALTANGGLAALSAANVQTVKETMAYTTDGRFNLAQTLDAIGRTTSYSYNDFNQTTEIVDIGGRVTRYAYDIPSNPSPANPIRYDLSA